MTFEKHIMMTLCLFNTLFVISVFEILLFRRFAFVFMFKPPPSSCHQIVRRLAKLELDLKAEKVRREAAEKEMLELSKAVAGAPVVVPAKLS